MAYATQTDITDRYGTQFLLDISDRDGDLSVDTTAVTAALDDGAAEIDCYIAVGGPIPSTSPILTLINVDFAIYRLASTHDVLTDEITKRYERWIEKLKMVASGALTIGTGWDVTITSETREFTRTKQRGLL